MSLTLSRGSLERKAAFTLNCKSDKLLQNDSHQFRHELPPLYFNFSKRLSSLSRHPSKGKEEHTDDVMSTTNKKPFAFSCRLF